MTFEELYEKLEKFVHYLAHSKANGAFLMDHDEISGELFEVMVKGYARYNHLPKEELLAVIKKMMDNKISDLIYTHYVTHRGLAIGSDSIPESDNPACDWTKTIAWSSNERLQSVSSLVESRERVQDTYNRLSPNAQRVFQAIILGSPELDLQLEMSYLRASYIYQDEWKVKVRSWQIADSLSMGVSTVKKALTEIRKVYAEVSNVSV